MARPTGPLGIAAVVEGIDAVDRSERAPPAGRLLVQLTLRIENDCAAAVAQQVRDDRGDGLTRTRWRQRQQVAVIVPTEAPRPDRGRR